MNEQQEKTQLGEAVAGFEDVPDGRYPMFLTTSSGENERSEVERREGHIAIKLRGRWYGVRPEGVFVIHLEEPHQRILFHGTVEVCDRQLHVEAVETNLDSGKATSWRGQRSLLDGIDGTAQMPKGARQQVVMRGTAFYSLLDGPTRTPLSALVFVTGGEARTVVLPPSLTGNRGELTLEIDTDGAFAFKPEQESFKVEGRLDDDELELIVESSGSLGWAKKKLHGSLS